MNPRSVLVSPYQVGALDALSAALNLEPFTNHLPRIDVPSIVFASLIQAGASQFQILRPSIADFVAPAALSDRIIWLPDDQFDDLYLLVRKQIEDRLPEGYHNLPGYQGYSQATSLIVDLFAALQRGSSIVSALPIPKPEELGPAAPPEIRIPIANLLRILQPQSLALPQPIVTVGDEAVRAYKQILESDLFREYGLAHSSLEGGSSLKPSTLSRIQSTGAALGQRFTFWLRPKETSVVLLDLGAKVVDTVFGKLPGKLAEKGAQLASKALGQDRRVVVHDHGNLTHTLFLDRLLQVKPHWDDKKSSPS